MAADSDPPVIRAEGLGRRFRGTWALRDIDLTVRQGEIVGLVGPDGAGKTTLLQLLAAILDPSEGLCRVLGFDSVRQASAITGRVGYMAQGFTLYERLTVAENLAFAGRARSVPPARFAERRGELLAMAGLAPFVDRVEGALSGGMRKKLALCTNLIHEPPLLLLDEPGLGVDPRSRRELWRMLESFRQGGTTIVLATSYMDEADRCDRVAFLDRGHLVAQGTPDALRDHASGTVFQMTTDRPAAAESMLKRAPEVVGVQWRPEGLRFAVDPALENSSEFRAQLGSLGAVAAAPPTIEDVFVVLRKERIDDATHAPDVSIVGPREVPAIGVNTRGLARRFGRFVAVDDVSLRIAPGEIFGLLGANGAGKTTLIRMLCGLLPPSAGVARVAGVDIAARPRALRRLVGYMSQRFSLYPDLTVDENLNFFAAVYGLGRGEARERIAGAVAMTGLGGLGADVAVRLSGALRQRLALACSLLHRPAVLFLDEPTSGVDPLARYRFWDLIRRLAEAGTTVVVTTHYLEEASYCHRLGFMHQGRMLALGDLASLRAGLPGDAEESLEDVFLAYIERADAEAASATAEAS